MAWLSRNNFVAGESMSHAYLNHLANDIRAWGGDVNASGYRIANIVGITGASNTLAIGTDAPAAALDIYGAGTLWNNGTPLYQQFVTADRTLQLKSATQAVINLVSDIDTDGGAVGGLYFARSAGQADAHRTVAGLKALQSGTGTLAFGSLAVITKGAGGAAETARFTSSGFGLGITPQYQVHVYGAGQSTGALADGGATGGTIYAQDSGAAGGNGGAIVFGATQGKFAAIKGLIHDGSGNTLGHLAISTRSAIGDTAMTERVRVTFQGRVGIGKTAPGSMLAVAGLPIYADNAAATGGGLTAGDFYRTSTGQLGVVY